MRRYHRVIFFTKTKLGGYYKYRDIFQIFPMALNNMPNIESPIIKHHANILEFWIEDKDEISLPDYQSEFSEYFGDASSIIIKQDKIFSLLSTFSNYHFFRYNDTIGSWGIPVSKAKNEQASSEWVMKIFHFPELPNQFNINKFTEINIEEIKRIDFSEYYTKFPSSDSSREDHIKLPSSIDLLLDKYFSLSSDKTNVLDVVLSYVVSSLELKDKRKTLSLLTLFTALEALVNLEYRYYEIEKCEACNQQKYSVSKKFREFLLKYIGSSAHNKKKFNNLYELRSKIVHAGR